MKLKPLLDNVVVKKIEENENMSKGGILLPKSAQEKSNVAIVISVGEGGIVDGNEVKMVVKPNDKILFSKFAGTEFKADNEEFILLKQADILAIIEE